MGPLRMRMTRQDQVKTTRQTKYQPQHFYMLTSVKKKLNSQKNKRNRVREAATTENMVELCETIW